MSPIFILILLLLSLATPLGAEELRYDTKALDRTLSAHVQEGRVDYEGLLKDREDLDRFVAMLGKMPAASYNALGVDGKLAFWINAYNAICLQGILNNYPCDAKTLFRYIANSGQSPKNVKGFFKTPHRVMGSTHTLDHIQRVVLRLRMHDVRALFAACPAALGGPSLRHGVYEGEGLGNQLEAQIRQQLANKSFVELDHETKTARLSEFFKWFGEDFIPIEDRTFIDPELSEKEWAIREFLMDRMSEEDAELLGDPDLTIVYRKYDWTLNSN